MNRALGPWLGWGAFATSLSFVPLGLWAGPSRSWVLYVAFNALFNLPHQYCTWVRVVRAPVVRRLDHARRVGAFLLLGLAAVGFARADVLGPTNEALLVNFMPYWGLWHLVAQHVGISSLLRRRGGERDPLGRRRARSARSSSPMTSW